MSERLGPPLGAPLFDRLALIGVGLIGSSIARAARRKNLARVIAIADDVGGGARARDGAEARRQIVADPAEAAARTPISSFSACRSAPTRRWRATIAPRAEAGRDRLRRRLGQGRGDRRGRRRICPRASLSCPAHPVAGTEQSGPDAGFADAVRQPLVHPDAAGRRRRPGGGRRRCARSGRRSAPTSRR